MKAAMVEATHANEARVERYYTWRASNYDAGTCGGQGLCKVRRAFLR